MLSRDVCLQSFSLILLDDAATRGNVITSSNQKTQENRGITMALVSLMRTFIALH